VRLLITDDTAAVATCAGHAAWLRGYAVEDPAVRYLGDAPELRLVDSESDSADEELGETG